MSPPLPAALEPLSPRPLWVGWKTVRKPGEKPKKLPIQASTGKAARSNDPTTWAPFADAAAAVARFDLEGAGIMFADLGDGRRLIGLDLDLCRSPVTGEIMPWAREKIARWNTYGEISPSGTGVKLFGYVTRPLEVVVNEITVDAPVPEGAEGADHDRPEIGLYPATRYFTVTGQRLGDAPDRLADVTEAAAELAAEMARLTARAGRTAATARRAPRCLRPPSRHPGRQPRSWPLTRCLPTLGAPAPS